MIYKLYLVLIMLITITVHAETKGVLNLKSGDSCYEGDIVEAQLEVHPGSVQLLQPLYQMVGKRFLDHFYLVSVNQIKESQNNYEYIVADLTIVPISKPKENFALTNLGDIVVPVDFGFQINQTPMDGINAFNTWDLKRKGNSLNSLIIFLGILLLSVFGFLLKRKKGSSPQKVEHPDWKKAETRESFEQIYLYYKKAEMVNKEIFPPNEYMKIIEENMYKRKWDESVYSSLKQMTESK